MGSLTALIPYPVLSWAGVRLLGALRHLLREEKAQSEMWESWSWLWEGKGDVLGSLMRLRLWGPQTLGHPGAIESLRGAENGVGARGLGLAWGWG